MDDGDILFNDLFRIYQRVGKNIFFFRENGISLLQFLPIPQNVLLKGPEKLYF